MHSSDFVKAIAEGAMDREETKKALRAIAMAAEPLDDYKIVLDVRNADSTMSAIDIWYIAEGLSDTGAAFRHKTALLCRAERFDDAGFFALCAENRGYQIRAFTSFEEAIEWLLS